MSASPETAESSPPPATTEQIIFREEHIATGPDERNNPAIVQLTRTNSTASAGEGSCCSSSLGVGTFSNLDLNKDDDEDDDIMVATNTTTEDDLDNLVAVDDRLPDDEFFGQHPALKTVCVMDCNEETRIIPNSNEPFPLNNECFEGKVMLLMRTPDVDHPRDRSQLGPQQMAVSQYFKGKKRRFEFQFQIKLKKVPTGPLFLGCELQHSIKIGAFTKGLVNLLLAMVRRINPGFHYSWGPISEQTTKKDYDQITKDDNYEKTHLSFPVEASMDRIIITKPGQRPPTLGQELLETPESVKRRRKMGAGSVDWNTSDIYTMCLWSAYADWIKWRSINVPGVSPFSLSRVTGQQPIYLSVYEITSCKAADYKKQRPPHLQKDLKVYTRLEFSNIEKTVGGLADKHNVHAKEERVAGGRRRHHILPPNSEHSLPDTESDLGSDMETLSRISHITN